MLNQDHTELNMWAKSFYSEAAGELDRSLMTEGFVFWVTTV